MFVMKKITLLICTFTVYCLVLFNPIEVRANFIPGDFNGWTQNTPYSTTNMPNGFKKYTAQTSNDAGFKLLRYNNNWNDGWGSGYWINSWNTVWSLNHVTGGLSNALVKNFGTSQYMTVITSTSLGAATSKFGFLKTSATPINISSVSGGTTNVNTNSSVSINITLSGSKSAEEYVLVRYTTNNWSSSSFVIATGSGTSYSATIPGQAASTTVNWYAMTSTVASPSTDTDYLTLSVMNNSGTNYNYFTGESAASDYFRSKATGNWNTSSSWESSVNGSSNWVAATLVPGNSASGITILNGHNITLDANVSISNLTINTGATFTASDATPRILTISKSAAGSSTTLANSGTWANGVGGSTLVFTGAPSSGDAVHATTGTIAFQNLTVNKTGGSSNVGASFGAGTSLTGTLEIGTGGFISTNPPTGFYGTGAILKFNQGALATYDVNLGDKTWSTTEVPQNITVTSGKVRMNENRTATGNLIISVDGTLELAAAKQLSINSTLTNNGTLTLKSVTGVGTATIITLGTVNGSGTTNVEQFVSSVATGATGRNWYISSPLSAATSSTITTTTGNDLVYWNGTAWTAAETNMAVMKGYIAVSPNGNKTILFTGGNLNTGSQSLTNLPSGFNLVGNPYASYVDFEQATKTNVTGSIWYRSKSSGSYVFQTYNVPSNIGANDGSAIIPPLQSFWIKTTSASNTFGLTNTMRSHQDQSVATNRLKAPAASIQKLARLEVAAGADKDETVVYFNPSASNTFDEYDSQKMFNETAGSPEIYTFTDSKNLVINGFNDITLNTEIPLGFRTGITTEGQSYTLKASQLLNFGNDVEMVLVDKQNSGSETVLNEGVEFTFTSDAVNTTSRFSLVFRTKGSTTGGCCFGIFDDKIRIQKNESNQLVVNCDNGVLKNATIAVYNTAGQKLMQQNIQSSTTILPSTFKAGVYLVKLQSEGKTYHVKVSI